jgi:protein phosphatase
VRITHDHSYVEELVDAGEITADEARIHPSRSIITRALGSDPDMYADHFTLEVSTHDRIIICSDGLSSMVSDKSIEDLAISSVTPQAAADTLVSAALTAGGHDNVTVIVVDVLDDGLADVHRRHRNKTIGLWLAIALVATVVIAIVFGALLRTSWYVGNNNGTVAICRGVAGDFFGLGLHEVVETTSVSVSDLPEATRHQLDEGISVSNEAEARRTVERYRDQIDADKTRAAEAAAAAQSSAGAKQEGETLAGAEAENGDSTPEQAAANGMKAENESRASATQSQTLATGRMGD